MMTIQEIDLELIDDPKVDIRGDIDTAGLEDLATSIQTVGLIQPITVFKKQGRFEVVCGHRRALACKAAGLKKIPAIVRDVDPDEIDVMRLDENVFREDVSPIQIARYIARIMDLKKVSVVEISRYFQKTPQWVNSMIRLLDADEYTQAAVDAGELSYVAALELQKIEDEQRRRMYTEAAVKGGAHTRTVRNWVQEESNERRVKDSGEKVDPEEGEQGEPQEYKQKCMLCGKLRPVNELITVQVGVKCYPQLREICKNYRDLET